MSSCYLHTEYAVLQGRSCGRKNISLGKSSNVPDTPRSPILYLAIKFRGLYDAMRSLRMILSPRIDEKGNRVEVKVSKVRVRFQREA
jgi:hypothetical protein